MEYHTISDGYRYRNLKGFQGYDCEANTECAHPLVGNPANWGKWWPESAGNPMNCLAYGCKCNSLSGPDCGARRQHHKDGTPKDTAQTLFCGPIDGFCA